MSNQPPQFPGQQYPGPQYPGQQPSMPGQQPGFYAAPPQPPVKPRKPWFKRFWVWAVAIVVIIGASQALGGNGSSTTASDQQDAQTLTQASDSPTAPAKAKAPASTTRPKASQTRTTQAKPTERLTLDKGWKIDKSNPFGVYVKGYVSNNSDKPITNYAQITFDVLDKNGANLGTCIANTNTIDAHGKWRFEAICDGDPGDVATVRFKEISGF